jgi:hypothetical protein
VLITKFYSVDQIQRDELGGACGRYGRGERPWEPEVNRSLGRRRRRWKCKYIIDLQIEV